MRLSPVVRVAGAILVALAIVAPQVYASSHREALAILNEPCADNTDTYAWVSNGTHDKLYLIMDFNPLHEPGQGNQGLRACNGYRYEFHIGKGTSLKDEVVYRVEFKNTLKPEAAPSADRSARRRQRAALAAHRRHRDDEGHARRSATAADDATMTTVGPRREPRRCCRTTTARRPIGWSTASARSRATTPAIPPAAKSGLYDQTFVDTLHPHAGRTAARIIAGQFDDPYQLDEKGIFDLVNLDSDDLGGIPGARRPPAKDVFTGFNLFSIALEVPIADIFPHGIPHNGTLKAELDRQPAARVGRASAARQTQTVDASNIITGLKGSGDYVQVGRNALPLFNAGLVGTQRQTLYLHTEPAERRDQLRRRHPVPGAGARRRSARHLQSAGRSRRRGGHAQGTAPRHHQRHQPRAGRFRSPTASPATSSRSTRPSIRVPNGRRLGGGTAPNRNQVNVNSVLISLIVAGDPGAGLAKGVEVNDKDYLDRVPVPGASRIRVCSRDTAARMRSRRRSSPIRLSRSHERITNK